MRDLQTGLDTRLTFNKAQDTGGAWFGTRYLAWFPSGDRLLHMAGRVEASKLVVRRSDVAGEARELTAGTLARISADGHTLLYLFDDRGRGRLRRAPLLPDGTVGAAQLVFRDGNEPNVTDIDVSPDGRLLAYAARQADGRLNVFLTEFANIDGRLQVTEGGTRPRFSPDGRELFFLKGTVDERGQPKGLFMSTTVTVKPTLKIGTSVQLFADGGPSGTRIEGYGVSRDGRRFVMSKSVAPPPGEGTRIVLVQNWLAAIKK